MLVRLTDPEHVRPIMRKHLLAPVSASVVVVVVAFAQSKRGFEPDMFTAMTGDRWLTVIEVTNGFLVLFLSGYVGRLMLSLRHDHRARTTLFLYLAAMTFAAIACTAAVLSIWIGGYAGPVIWVCISLSVGIFAYGLARSWQAKRAWFTASDDDNVIDAQ